MLLGTVQRVFFARMASAMPAAVLLMHTLIAALSLLLFAVLQLARNQSSGAPVSEQLQNDVLSLAASDHAFTALKNDGSLVSWGDADSGGVTPTLLDPGAADVNEVIANDRAFAARLADGSPGSPGSPTDRLDRNLVLT